MGGIIEISPIYEFEQGTATLLKCSLVHVELNEYADIKYQLFRADKIELFHGTLRMGKDDYEFWDNDSFIYEWVKKQLML